MAVPHRHEQAKSQPEGWPPKELNSVDRADMGCSNAAPLHGGRGRQSNPGKTRTLKGEGCGTRERTREPQEHSRRAGLKPHTYKHGHHKRKTATGEPAAGRNDPRMKKTSAGGGNSLWRGGLRGETEQRGILLDDSTVLGGSRKCRGPSGRVAGAFP